MQRFLSQIFGTRNDRVIKGIVPLVEQINALESGLVRLDDAGLRGLTVRYRDRLDQDVDDRLDHVVRDAVP